MFRGVHKEKFYYYKIKGSTQIRVRGMGMVITLPYWVYNSWQYSVIS